MKPDIRPMFGWARQVPYALQEAVEAEYNRLEADGTVEKVKFSARMGDTNSARTQSRWVPRALAEIKPLLLTLNSMFLITDLT